MDGSRRETTDRHQPLKLFFFPTESSRPTHTRAMISDGWKRRSRRRRRRRMTRPISSILLFRFGFFKFIFFLHSVSGCLKKVVPEYHQKKKEKGSCAQSLSLITSRRSPGSGAPTDYDNTHTHNTCVPTYVIIYPWYLTDSTYPTHEP